MMTHAGVAFCAPSHGNMWLTLRGRQSVLAGMIALAWYAVCTCAHNPTTGCTCKPMSMGLSPLSAVVPAVTPSTVEDFKGHRPGPRRQGFESVELAPQRYAVVAAACGQASHSGICSETSRPCNGIGWLTGNVASCGFDRQMLTQL